MTDFTYAVDADGVATILWDVKAKSMNVMSTDAFALLSSLIDQALADAGVIAPADLDLFVMVDTAEEAIAAIDAWPAQIG